MRDSPTLRGPGHPLSDGHQDPAQLDVAAVGPIHLEPLSSSVATSDVARSYCCETADDTSRRPAPSRLSELDLSRRRFLGGLASAGAAGVLFGPVSATTKATRSLSSPTSSAVANVATAAVPKTYTLVQKAEGKLTLGAMAGAGQDGPSVSATYSSNNKAGSLLVAIISRTTATSPDHNVGANVAPTVGRLSDTAGNRWKQVCEGLASAPFPTGLGMANGVDMWCCETSAGGAAPTVTAQVEGYPTNNVTMQMLLLEYSGGNGFELVGTIGVADVKGSTVTATTVDACDAHDLLVTALVGDCSAATAPAGFTPQLADGTAGLWVADQPDSGAAAGIRSAPWTGLNGATTGYCLIAAFRPVGSTTGPRCWQTSFSEPALSTTGWQKEWTSRPYPVNPKPGNTLIAIILPYGGVSTTAVQDTAGNTWKLGANSGLDPVAGTDASIWVCQSCVGGPTALTASISPQMWGGCAFLLLEYSGLPPSMVVDQEASELNFSPTPTPSLSTPAPTQQGDFVLGWLGGSYWYYTGITKAPGWRQRFTDSAGSAGLAELQSSSSGTQTTSWSYGQGQAGFMMVVAFR